MLNLIVLTIFLVIKNCYKKLHADFDELKSQNSYLVNDLDNVFKDESDGGNL